MFSVQVTRTAVFQEGTTEKFNPIPTCLMHSLTWYCCLHGLNWRQMPRNCDSSFSNVSSPAVLCIAAATHVLTLQCLTDFIPLLTKHAKQALQEGQKKQKHLHFQEFFKSCMKNHYSSASRYTACCSAAN